ncbi:hypothetical protein [Paraclostridium bifermentans]|uniref:hypothetical protein n=1 Tax=Paraclostridium bifermentans TaxID=1490 RepID=UPI001C80A05D|nr:hypothetical protein [Paraclostridium bifermentans]GIM32987.1 hypothetical protein PAGU1678_22570 [Paraclostridium bifermentans subsp. muricolitidis]
MKKIFTVIIFTIFISLLIVGCGKKSALGKYHEEDVKNGLGEKIGTRLVVDSNENNINDENIIKFYNETVKNNKYKYITVDLNNGEGLVFNTDNFFIKGNIDENGMISKTKELGQIKDNKINYQENK